ncbi:MAG: glycosyltransferase family 4 protein [Deltaproteobacteria bacterium]|nr:MAG: glycosyltransferase family 4 protein [Deltaproteobacteria bacterium]
MKVALVHDWLTGLRGGERVLEQLCQLYPAADVFTLVHVPGSAGPIIERHKITASFLDRLPLAHSHHRRYLPLFPRAVESLDLRGYQLVLSTSHAVAKGCIPPEGATHVAYIHTPMRYVWDQFDAYFGPGRAGLLTRIAAHAVAPFLRRWDVRSTRRAHGIVANSNFVAERIRRFWGREADAVVYPPVDTHRFVPAAEGPDEYALIVSALVPYKRLDLAVRAFSRAKRPLLVAGDGPEMASLRALAGPSVRFLGAVPFEDLPRLYARARFFVLPGEEDFGIAPVEAQAAGRPVLALGSGGALETVIEGQTGVFFPEPTVESLLRGLALIDELRADPALIRAHAERFAAGRFAPELKREIDRVIARRA